MSDLDQQAVWLAGRHYEIETGISDIVRLEQDVTVDENSVRKIGLLEVNSNTVPAGIMPIEFGPAPSSGLNYPSVIVEVTPEEFERILSHQLALPAGWRLGSSIPRPEATQCP